MDSVYAAVIKAADDLYNEYLRRETESGNYPAYKASGMGYIRFAREEKELFKLLFMRDRSQETHCKDEADIAPIVEMIRKNTGLDEEAARLFHLEIWAGVHGIAAMAATNYLELNRDALEEACAN